MMFQKNLRRIALFFATISVLTGLACASSTAAYTMTLHNGFVCVMETASGDWVYRSQVHADMLSPRDQLLLQTGISLHNQAEFTSAVEDFCS